MPASETPSLASPDFRLLFESAPGLYLVLNPHLYIVAATNAYLKVTMTRREDILGRYLFEVFPDNPEEEDATGVNNLRASLEKVICTGVMHIMAVQKYDIRRPDCEGGGFEERYWSPTNYPILGNDQQLAFIIHHVKDVTEYVSLKKTGHAMDQLHSELRFRSEKMEAEIYSHNHELHQLNAQLYNTNQTLYQEIQAREDAEEAVRKLNEDLLLRATQLELSNKELESFSYSVSHDLRAPLRAIDGFSRMLEEDYSSVLDAEGKRKLKIIRDNSKNMGQLIDDLLMLSRFGKKELSYINLPMAALAQKAYDENIGTHHTFHFLIHELPPASGDPVLMQQVWINLISNAIKFSAKKEHPQIEVGGYTEGQEAVYYVKDNGAGFDMRYYDKLFGVFQRLHRVDEFYGTGVGLAIVQRILHRHHGRVWAQSSVGEGSVFSFALPLKEMTGDTL